MNRSIPYDPRFAVENAIRTQEDKGYGLLSQWLSGRGYSVAKMGNLNSYDCVVTNNLNGNRIYAEVKVRNKNLPSTYIVIGDDKVNTLSRNCDDITKVYIFQFFADGKVAVYSLDDLLHYGESYDWRHKPFTLLSSTEEVKEKMWRIPTERCKIYNYLNNNQL